ncbi:hypothetical protein [Paremcibacter congregatus]|uniref:Uncharacterized protein n=1 Tax=Paremcibacter congregatus TaxID=2043170 RepID=A0A2G4YM51_9PROT|nr:hypothetical protein [Paremcibacter congregatus]PHZ83378.1 hypothetical protein CRD36_17595 [Paremcibacter congregatus]QDE28152.1 hypothetical protein FIV45_13205 [Paremcibacter congregatus]
MTSYNSYIDKVQGKNINAQTLLATDYLNHFNEVHMLIDMLPTMPDCLEDIKEWVPKSYQEHFADSVFTEKDLAIEAFEHAPAEYRLPFEATVNEMDSLVLKTIQQAETCLERQDTDQLQSVISQYTPKMRDLIEKCGCIINGEKHMTQQDSIDHYFDDNESSLDGEDLDQSTIDDLFG